MTHPEHVASVERPRSGCLASAALWLALFATGVAAAGGASVLRANAAAACDVLEGMGGIALTFFSLVLVAVNVVLATGLWALLQGQRGLGVAAVVVLGVPLFILSGLVFLALTGVPDGYPTPPEACPGGEPPWWPSFLPG